MTQRSIDETQQHIAMGNPTIAGLRIDNGCQFVGVPGRLAALTEQCRMAGGSIKARVDRRCACRNQLDLRMGDRAVFVLEIPDLLVSQVKFNIEIKEVEDFLRNQTHGAVNVLVAVNCKRIQVAWRNCLRRQRCDPCQVPLRSRRSNA